MHELANEAREVKEKLALFDNRPSDYEIVMTKLPELIGLIEKLESMAVRGRKVVASHQYKLPLYTGLIDIVCETKGKKFLSEIEKNVTVSLKDDVLTLKLFPLIKSLSSKTKEYLSLLIGDALKSYFESQQIPDFGRCNCVIVINTLYASADTIKDNDSIETAAIINALKTYFFVDDGLQLSIYRTGSMSDRHETEIHLMKQSDFMLWLLRTTGAQETE